MSEYVTLLKCESCRDVREWQESRMREEEYKDILAQISERWDEVRYFMSNGSL